MPDARARRSSFGPVVLAGLASAGLATIAGTKPWAHATGHAAQQVGAAAGNLDAGQVPAANAFGLVCLACWGVVLVTRGRVRRVVSVLAVLAAVAVAAAVVVGFTSAPHGVRTAYAGLGSGAVDTGRTGWFWIAALGAAAGVVTTVLAVRLAPTWPEMGRRYDAPASADPPTGTPDEEPTSLDLWKALDEGRDPTLGP